MEFGEYRLCSNLVEIILKPINITPFLLVTPNPDRTLQGSIRGSAPNMIFLHTQGLNSRPLVKGEALPSVHHNSCW
uniref:Putative ovule protein n=1 Tax=Solanum chacoense TaxID=4108 RepID=A0A0V0H548_SOLCH